MTYLKTGHGGIKIGAQSVEKAVCTRLILYCADYKTKFSYHIMKIMILKNLQLFLIASCYAHTTNTPFNSNSFKFMGF